MLHPSELSDLSAGIDQFLADVVQRFDSNGVGQALSLEQQAERKILVLSSVGTALQFTLTKRLVDERRRLNALRPINQLPPEILSTIMTLAVAHSPSAQYYRDLHILSWVSSSWRAFVVGSPALWSRITTSYTLELISQVLDRSKAALLDLEVHPTPRSGVELALAPVLDAPERWRSLRLMSRLPTTWEWHHLALPNLTKLDLNFVYTGHRALDTFREAPRLRELTLKGCLIPWNSALFSSTIESLEISHFYDPPLSPLDILNTIARLTKLRHLSLITFELSTDVYTGPHINLEQLETLTIEDTDLQSSRLVLGPLQWPATSSLTIQIDCKGIPEGTIMLREPAIEALIRKMKAMAAWRTPLHIVISDEHHRTRVEFKSEVDHRDNFDALLNAEFSDLPRALILEALESMATEAEKFHVTLELDLLAPYGRDADGRSILQLLGYLPTIECLILELWPDILYEHVLEYLHEPRKLSDEDTCWMLSKLKHLQFKNPLPDNRSVLRTLQRRTSGEGGLALPAKLETLSLCNSRADGGGVLPELEELLGPGAVTLQA